MAATIDKLRPELLEISDAEFERRQAELEMAARERRRRAEVAAKEALAAEAATRIERVVADIKWLHDNDLLPKRVAEGFSRGDGMFVPGMILRAPSAESLVPRADKPKRKRRTREEVDAARAAGEPARRRR
ncbi:hypothetical protein LB521_27575 [Mesorhizobium sp. BR-1-1-8]|uniref:hypothetical protein n=1 Tax=Mesorhizobium sp. BR-1-1-8 TaxID=2876659 RepID=UPI001CCD6D36|nr:hypothetical protein [Mesorhizobium sp. BR-1-1-8]MBZ9984897.1 hypothetical protein [Mesorhizobium sp. BR-1-1-8]